MDSKHVRPDRAHSQFSTDDTLQLCSRILDHVDRPLAKSLADSVRSGRHEEVVTCSFDSTGYGPNDFEAFALDYFSYNLLRKFSSFKICSIDKRASALTKFCEGEMECKSSNSRIPYFGTIDRAAYAGDVNMVLYHARRKIQSVLGNFDWDYVMSHADFSGGASTRLPRSRSTLYDKVQGCLHLTEALKPHFECFQAHKPGLFDGCVVVDGNKIVSVPKDAKVDRIIAIEPDYNMFVQKAIGAVIRERLKSKTKERIDLNDQTHNQTLALIASLGFGLSTIDLSSASDTISTSLVSNLLPIDWFEAMDLCRSKIGTLPNGDKVVYEKFSSMGNGYTFELESLIFWALCQGVIAVYGNGTEYVSVYGDDIVINSSLYGPLVGVFAYAGFTINARKSFAKGFFYESCGKHYFNGRDVSPVYVDKVPQRIIERISMANELILFSSRLGHGLYRDILIKPCIDSLISTLPKWLQKPRAPVSCKGNAIVGDFDECLPSKADLDPKKRWYEGYTFTGLIETKIGLFHPVQEIAVRSSLFTLEWRSYCDGTPTLSKNVPKFGKLRSKRITVCGWSYLGPWI